MMEVDVLIIGLGLCGSHLSRELERLGMSCMVIDELRPSTASRVAAGLINPVTGRRMVKTWMIDELLPLVKEVYGELGTGLLRQISVVDFFPTPQMRLAFLKRLEEGGEYLRLASDDHDWDTLFRYELGYGLIEPCYLVDTQSWLQAVRERLVTRGLLRQETFDPAGLAVHGSRVRYRDIEAGWVIFCDGVAGAAEGYFSLLPFALNKGEALVIEAPHLEGNDGFVFKRGVSLVPWKDGLYWVGSSYEWSFSDPGPTVVFRERTEALLWDWLKVPFTTVEHLASVRPATLERRPFVGLHPSHPRVGTLNGMGTKGCSLAPFFARRLARLLAKGETMMAEADVGRFRRILGGGSVR